MALLGLLGGWLGGFSKCFMKMFMGCKGFSRGFIGFYMVLSRFFCVLQGFLGVL